jgi:phosphoserine phosphatase
MKCADRSVTDEEIRSVIDPRVLAELDRIEGLNRPQKPLRKLAALDMDGTLLYGDIGDAVLAMLVSRNRIPVAYWNEYQALLGRSPRTEAHQWALRAMKGLSLDDVRTATNEVLAMAPDERILISPAGYYPRPRLIPEMQSLVIWLHRTHYEVFIVTATNQWTAEAVAYDFFGIAEDHVVGMQVELDGKGRLTDEIKYPSPSGFGKLGAWKQRFGEQRPLVVAGDSDSDRALINFVSENGLAIWTGIRDDTPSAKNVVDLSSLRGIDCPRGIERGT